jgi:four helix bundle protein
MKDFKNLQVWERSHLLTLAVYEMTTQFPKEELFGLTSQLRRSAASIPTNIAEGCGRSTDADFARFLQIAFGSACEAEYQIILARDLRYINEDLFSRISNELIVIKKMISSLLSRLRAEC